VAACGCDMELFRKLIEKTIDMRIHLLKARTIRYNRSADFWRWCRSSRCIVGARSESTCATHSSTFRFALLHFQLFSLQLGVLDCLPLLVLCTLLMCRLEWLSI
jgi:hypothetical protein